MTEERRIIRETGDVGTTGGRPMRCIADKTDDVEGTCSAENCSNLARYVIVFIDEPTKGIQVCEQHVVNFKVMPD